MEIFGLSTSEAASRLRTFGLNELKEINKISALQILVRQIRSNFVIYLLFFAALLSFILGKTETAIVISAVITLVISTGFLQEYKAENAIQALKRMIMPVSRVIRDGKEHEIPSREIVPGDIVVLRTGEKIPADCIILEESNLKINESILTGESKEISKSTDTDTNKSPDENMIFMGTFVVNGRCVAEVKHTGMNTKFGHIAGMISTAEKKLPLQQKVNTISKYMVTFGIIAALLTGFIMYMRADTMTSETIVGILILVIALCVSSFPEGFPVVLTTTLAVGMNRMAKQNAIINRMSIIETLGETTVICSDKTGTLTKGEMTIKHLYANNILYDVSGIGYEGTGSILKEGNAIDIEKNKTLHYLLTTAVLCNDSNIERFGDDNFYKVVGSATEGALLILGAKANIFKENFGYRHQENPFNSERKMMSVSYRQDHEHAVFAKGALEVLLDQCSLIQHGDKIIPLTTREKDHIVSANSKLTSKAFRTLAFAYKIDKNSHEQYSETNLVFLGLAAMEDPPRAEVKKAVETCLQSGIKIKMITGDNKATAQAIGEQIGITGKVILGEEINALTDEELAQMVNSITIFSRVKPEHKLRIVRALKKNGEIVTMTGDGVNDAPALKEAHIGVAMGINGTDVSRSVADITLKDDNFATIVIAIKEGRTIFNNIRKFVSYQLSCNLADIIVLFVGVVLGPIYGWHIPVITALQILFMNIATDNIPAITLGFTPTSQDIMKERPRKKNSILTPEFIRLVIFNGASMGAIVILTLFLTYNIFSYPSELARTTVLITMMTVQIVNAFNFRSFRFRVLNRGIFINLLLVIAACISFILTFFILYTPLNFMFETVPLGIEQWLIALSGGLVIAVIFDIFKTINNKTHLFIHHTT